ncbi:MAG: TrmH family RNA methyltransferase [Trueperaceae bacterium]
MHHEPAPVESPTNPRVKRLVRLRERRARDAEGVGLVEGAREVDRALEGGWNVVVLATCTALYSPAARALASRREGLDTERWALSEVAFRKASLRQHPDGVLALVVPPKRALTDLPAPSDALWLVADGLEKPGNLGALLRTADAADVDAVLVTGAGTDLANPNVVRASMGSLFARPVLAVAPDRARAELRARGMRVVATTPAATVDLWDADLCGPVAIVLGTEHAGLDPAWLADADVHVRVPMAGLADSLNVATTGALLLFEARRQRRAAAQKG